MSSPEPETNRIVQEYQRRARELPADFYALTRPVNLFFQQSKERCLLRTLQRANMTPLADRRIAEVGCGHGNWLATFEAFGARRENLRGIDLDPQRAEFAAQRFPQAEIRPGNAAALPWPDQSCDIVLQSMVLSSVLEETLRQQIAAEMLRVLAPGGVILWYDFFVNNPRNPNVRGVKRGEIAALFPACEISLSRITLAPPLARRIAPWSWPLATLLEKLWLLNTHYLGYIRPKHP